GVGNPFRAGITSKHNIIIAAAEPVAASPKVINIRAITEIDGTGFPANSSDSHHIDVLTNGFITLAGKTDHLPVAPLMSTARDVTLKSPRRIIDALNDGIGSEADVTGVNITMTAGDNAITGTPADRSGTGGIGTPDNFLEINVNVRNGSGVNLGVLRAFDTAAGLGNTQREVITAEVRGT